MHLRSTLIRVYMCVAIFFFLFFSLSLFCSILFNCIHCKCLFCVISDIYIILTYATQIFLTNKKLTVNCPQDNLGKGHLLIPPGPVEIPHQVVGHQGGHATTDRVSDVCSAEAHGQLLGLQFKTLKVRLVY